MQLFTEDRAEVEWLMPSAVMEAVRNQSGTKELHQNGAVKQTGAGVYEVSSASTGGANYKVELDLADLGPRPVTSMVVSCTCMDHMKRGPVCKHAGAALLRVCGPERALEDKSARGFPAASAIAPPAGSAAPVLTSLALPSSGPIVAYDGSALAGAAESRKDSAFAVLRDKAERIRRMMRDRSEPEGVDEAGVPETDGDEQERGVGRVLAVLDAVQSQEVAKAAIVRAREYVLVMAFTLDREDLVQRLIEAKGRGCEIVVVADRNFTLSGKTRDQLQRLQQLESNGARVRLASGHSCRDEYTAVGRKYSGKGIVHGKVVHTEQESIIGSCNWTTSSRSNVELGLHVVLNKVEATKVSTMIRQACDGGQPVGEAAVLAEQGRTRSASPIRGRRSSTSTSSALNFG